MKFHRKVIRVLWKKKIWYVEKNTYRSALVHVGEYRYGQILLVKNTQTSLVNAECSVRIDTPRVRNVHGWLLFFVDFPR